jgi:hypothetical protein
MYIGNFSGTLTDIATITEEDGSISGITSYQSFLNPGKWGLIKILKFPQTGSSFINQDTNLYIGLASTPENVLYGITELGYFGTIDLATGDFTKISETGLAASSNCSATYNSKDGQVYFSYKATNGNSSLYKIDPATGDATLLYDFPNGENVVGIYIDQDHNENVPAAAENLAVNFSGASLNGSITFHIPGYLYNGADASGEVSYTVNVDGTEVANGSSSYGSDVTANISVPANGKHTFTVLLKNAAGDSDPASIEEYVGQDTPLAPQNVALSYANGKFLITWDAVSAGVNDGFIAGSDVRYTVTRDNDSTVVAKDITATQYADTFAEPDQLTTYTYSVTAAVGDFTGEAGKSNAVTIGYITPDYYQDFDSEDALNGYTIIDANDDGETWKTEFGQVKIMALSNNANDDWFITPSVMLNAADNYEVAFDASALLASFNYFEQYEICIGTEPTAAGMTTKVQGSTSVTSNTAVRQVIPLNVETTGRYYIGIHCISAYPHATFMIDNLEIYKGSTDDAPGMVTDFTATADPQGELKATLTFTAPTVTKGGDQLESITKIQLLRDDSVFYTLEDVTPGQACTVLDEDALWTGTHTYAAVAFNEVGQGPKATTSVFVGFNTPSFTHTIDIIEDENDPGLVTVSWQPVTTDITGAKAPEGSMTYMLYVYDGYNYDCLGTGLTETSFTHRAVEAGHQTYICYYIYACNPGGIGDPAASEQKLVGTPHSVPFYESFPDGTQTTETFLSSSGWYLATNSMGIPASDGDNGYLLFFSNTQTASQLITGKVDFSGTKNPGLIFACYDFRSTDGTLSQNTVDVAVTVDNYTYTVQSHTADGNNKWHYVMVPLSDYANKTGIVTLTVNVVNCPYVMIDDLRIIELYDNNLTASTIDVPEHAMAGESFDVNVKVMNNGKNTASGYTVELYCNDELIDSKAGAAIESCYTGTVTFSVDANPATAGDARYYAKVVYDADEDMSDNTTATAICDVDLNNFPAPEELTATESDGSVILAWNEPNLSNLGIARVTESFEGYRNWVQDNFGDWTTIDADQYPVGGIQDTSGNPLVLENEYMAYCISNINTDGLEELLISKSGSKAAMAMYVYDPATYTQVQNDDWLITPELSGNEQKITFYASAVDSSLPEAFEILTSKTGTAIEDFELVQRVDNLLGAWQYYGVKVPTGTKYLAIRCVSTEGFLFFVDDISYTPANGETLSLELKGYNVYRDGLKINSKLVTDNTYLDYAGSKGTHNFRVSAVYDKGESDLSNEVSAYSSSVASIEAGAVKVLGGKGQITVIGAENTEIELFTTDGRLQGSYTGALTKKIPASAGIYIVKVGNTVAKAYVK